MKFKNPNTLNKKIKLKAVMLICVLVLVSVLVSCQREEVIQQNERSLKQEDSPEAHKPLEAEDRDTGDDQVRQHESEAAPPKEKQMEKDHSGLRLMFLGDTMMTGNVAKVMDEKGNDYPLSEFMPILEQADLVIANLETAVGTSGKLADKTYAFQTDPSKFELFNPLKGKVLFTLANNHGMDAPLEETNHHLTQLGYPYIGVGQNLDHAFQPYVNEINGVSFAVIAASRVIPTTDWIAGEDKPGMASAYTDEPLLSTIKHWAAQVDLVIVFLHWGEERGDHPNEIQLELEQKLASAGANLIIGSHPHVLQEFKWRNKKQATAFSLGNFVFTTSTTETANYTMALDIQVTSDKITKIKIWPGKIDFGLIRYLDENNDERAQVIERLQQLSPTIDIERDGKVRKKEK